MKRTIFICISLVAAPSIVATATAATAPLWTVSKTQKTVVRSTLLSVPTSERASLEDELASSTRLFAALQLVAWEEGNAEAASIYGNLVLRYSSALRTLRTGLAIERAQCIGMGRAHAGRFARFRCTVSSESFSIPSATLRPASAGELPAVVEGAPRRIAALHSTLSVRVTGKSTLTSRAIPAPAAPGVIGIE